MEAVFLPHWGRSHSGRPRLFRSFLEVSDKRVVRLPWEGYRVRGYNYEQFDFRMAWNVPGKLQIAVGGRNPLHTTWRKPPVGTNHLPSGANRSEWILSVMQAPPPISRRPFVGVRERTRFSGLSGPSSDPQTLNSQRLCGKTTANRPNTRNKPSGHPTLRQFGTTKLGQGAAMKELHAFSTCAPRGTSSTSSPF